MYIRQLGTFFFPHSNNNAGYNKAEGEEQEDGRSLYSVELFAHFDTDCSTHPDYVCSCINDDDDGEDIEDVDDKVNEMYCYKMTLKINTNDDDDKGNKVNKEDKEDKEEKKRRGEEKREFIVIVIVNVIVTREGDWRGRGRGRGRGRNWW